MDFRRTGRSALACWALSFLVQAVPAASQPVALVTDVSGRVSGPAAVTILTEIASGSQLDLAPGARLVALYLQSGDEYTFGGPGAVRFGAVEPIATGGAKIQKKAPPLGRGGNVIIKPVNVAQAAFVMRSGRSTARIRLLAPSGTRTLDADPEFRWNAVAAGARYRFELTDDTGKSLHESEVSGTSYRLPAGTRLLEGRSYTWEISARSDDGRRYVSAGDFSIADGQLRAEAEALRPGPGAPVSERVAYAAWLEHMELRDEAKKYWRGLAAERPDDEKLKALARE